MTGDALYEKHWLLAYEANVKRWLPSTGRTDHVDGDVNFGFLKRSNVFFYDSRRLAAPARRKTAKVPLPKLPTAPPLITFIGYE